MATKNYTFPSDSSGGNDYQPDLTDNADISVAFADFVSGVQSVLNSIGTDVSSVDNKLDPSSPIELSIPASKFILQGTQSANTVKFAVTNTGAITLTLPPAATTIVGIDSAQTLTNKTISTASISGTTTLTGTVNATGSTINSPTISSPTISNPTITGSISGNQDFNNNVSIDGTLAAGATSVSALTVNGLAIESGYIPIPGMIVMYTGATAPTGWAICNGTSGTPDLRDRFIIGAGSSFNVGTPGGSYTSGGAGDHNHNTNGVSGGYTTNTAYTEHGHNTYHAHNTGSAGSHSHNSSTGTSNVNSTRATGTGGGVAAPAHTHAFNTGTDGSHGHNVSAENPGTSVAGISHAHSGSFNTNGGSTSSQPGNHTHSVDRPLFYALMYIMKL